MGRRTGRLAGGLAIGLLVCMAHAIAQPASSLQAPAFAAPWDRLMVISGADALLEPFAADTARNCGCVTNAFGLSRFNPHPALQSGPGVPLDRPGLGTLLLEARATMWAPADGIEVLARAEDGRATAFELTEAARIYAGGLGVPRTRIEAERWRRALHWYHDAAARGDQDAQVELAYLYAMGVVIRRNDQAATYWYRAAARQDNRAARLSLAFMYMTGRAGVPDNLVALNLLERARPTRFLGDFYACGLWGDPDYERAVAAYEEALGDYEATFTLGSMYDEGCGVARDADEAFTLFKRAAEEGHPLAQIALSRYLRSGLGGEQNVIDAYSWAELARARLPPGESRDEALRERDYAAAQIPEEHLWAAHEWALLLLREAEKTAQELIAQADRQVRSVY